MFLVLLAAAFEGCGEEETTPDDAPAQVLVCDALESPPGGDEPIQLEGEGLSIGRPGAHVGFVLEDAACSIYVATPGNQGSSVEDGERITAIGRIARLDRTQARRLEFSREARGQRAAEEVGTDRGDRYFDAYALQHETLPEN